MVGGRDVGSATALHGETRLSLPHSPEASKSLATIRSFPFSLNDSPSRGPIFYEATPPVSKSDLQVQTRPLVDALYYMSYSISRQLGEDCRFMNKCS